MLHDPRVTVMKCRVALSSTVVRWRPASPPIPMMAMPARAASSDGDAVGASSCALDRACGAKQAPVVSTRARIVEARMCAVMCDTIESTCECTFRR